MATKRNMPAPPVTPPNRWNSSSSTAVNPQPTPFESLARQIWPHAAENLWSTPSLGIILGCGAIHLPVTEEQEPLPSQNPHNHPNRGTERLLQILISELAHLIWVLRCERVIQERRHHPTEIHTMLWAASLRLLIFSYPYPRHQ